jgi:hypothetical protein
VVLQWVAEEQNGLPAVLIGAQSMDLRKDATSLAIDSPKGQGEMIGPMMTEMATNLN